MNLAFWRDLSVALLAVEYILVMTAIGVAFYFILKGINWLDARIRRITPRIQESFSRIARTVRQVAIALAFPFITLDAFTRGAARAVANLLGR